MKNVKVRAFLNSSGAVDFDVDGVNAKHSKLNLPKDSGAHDIDFDLHDETSRDLRFDTAHRIWVDEDGPCPPSPGISSDQLSVARCNAGMLSATNSNSGRQRELRYQLNFVAEDGSRFTCDPIIQNGGG